MAQGVDLDRWRIERELQAAREVLLQADAASDPALRDCAEAAVLRAAERFMNVGRGSEILAIAARLDESLDGRTVGVDRVLRSLLVSSLQAYDDAARRHFRSASVAGDDA